MLSLKTKTNSNMWKVTLIFLVTISLGFSFMVYQPNIPNIPKINMSSFGPMYQVNYSNNNAVADGTMNWYDWDDGLKTIKLTKDGNTMAYIKAIQNGEKLCVNFWVSATNTSVESFTVAFDLDNDGNYNISRGDLGRTFLAPGVYKSTMFGSEKYPVASLSDASDAYGNVKWKIPLYSGGFSSEEYNYARKTKLNNNYQIEWGGEFCVRYTELNLSKGDDKSLRTIFALKYYKSGDSKNGWYSWPENADHPNTEKWGTLYTTTHWAQPGYCAKNSHCEDTEKCSISTHSCVPVECEDYEKAVNHTCVLKSDSCYDNSDCSGEETCRAHACVPVECEDYEKAVNHMCILKSDSCYDNTDCSSGKTCENNTCVVKESEETLTTTQPTTTPTTTHEGNMEIELVKNNGNLEAIVSGLNNCDGKIIKVRENDCDGKILCAIVSGNEGGLCDFEIPKKEGDLKVVACTDLDGDGSEEFSNTTYNVKSSEVVGGSQSNNESNMSSKSTEKTVEVKQENNNETLLIGGVVALVLVVVYLLADKFMKKQPEEPKK